MQCFSLAVTGRAGLKFSRSCEGVLGLRTCMFKAACPDLARRVKPEGGRAVESAEGASEAWRALLAAQCGGQKEPRLLGARLFGLDNATVARLVQALPHAPRCARFEAWAGPRPEPEPLVNACSPLLPLTTGLQ